MNSRNTASKEIGKVLTNPGDFWLDEWANL